MQNSFFRLVVSAFYIFLVGHSGGFFQTAAACRVGNNGRLVGCDPGPINRELATLKQGSGVLRKADLATLSSLEDEADSFFRTAFDLRYGRNLEAERNKLYSEAFALDRPISQAKSKEQEKLRLKRWELRHKAANLPAEYEKDFKKFMKTGIKEQPKMSDAVVQRGYRKQLRFAFHSLAKQRDFLKRRLRGVAIAVGAASTLAAGSALAEEGNVDDKTVTVQGVEYTPTVDTVLEDLDTEGAQ